MSHSPDSLKKDGIIEALEAHLSKNESTYGKNGAFSDFYKRTGSPVKRERIVSTESEIVVSKPRRRQTRLIEQEESPYVHLFTSTRPNNARILTC
jgi:hypothetical protein